MQTTQSRPPAAAPAASADLSSLLDQVLSNTTVTQRTKAIADNLDKRIKTIQDLLPAHLKDQAERFVKRACLYFQSNVMLDKCTPSSFITCVLKAAELGLAIDGRLAHAVAFNNRKKNADGKEEFVSEAQLMVDFKGIIAVCRRSNLIKDCYARLVYEADEFDAWEEDDQCHLKHHPFFGSSDERGRVVGVYAKIILNNGTWRYEWMDMAEVGDVRQRSRAKDRGPWVTDYAEMAKKTVIRRALKTYCDDPGINMLLDLDSADDVSDVSPPSEEARSLPDGRVKLNGNGARQASRRYDEAPAEVEGRDTFDGHDERTEADGANGDEQSPPVAESRDALIDRIAGRIPLAGLTELEKLSSLIEANRQHLGADFADGLQEKLQSRVQSLQARKQS